MDTSRPQIIGTTPEVPSNSSDIILRAGATDIIIQAGRTDFNSPAHQFFENIFHVNLSEYMKLLPSNKKAKGIMIQNILTEIKNYIRTNSTPIAPIRILNYCVDDHHFRDITNRDGILQKKFVAKMGKMVTQVKQGRYSQRVTSDPNMPTNTPTVLDSTGNLPGLNSNQSILPINTAHPIIVPPSINILPTPSPVNTLPYLQTNILQTSLNQPLPSPPSIAPVTIPILPHLPSRLSEVVPIPPVILDDHNTPIEPTSKKARLLQSIKDQIHQRVLSIEQDYVKDMHQRFLLMETELCHFVEHLIQDEPISAIVVTNQPQAESLRSIDDTSPTSKPTTTESLTDQMMLAPQQSTEQAGNDLAPHVETQNPTDSTSLEDEFQSPVQTQNYDSSSEDEVVFTSPPPVTPANVIASKPSHTTNHPTSKPNHTSSSPSSDDSSTTSSEATPTPKHTPPKYIVPVLQFVTYKKWNAVLENTVKKPNLSQRTFHTVDETSLQCYMSLVDPSMKLNTKIVMSNINRQAHRFINITKKNQSQVTSSVAISVVPTVVEDVPPIFACLCYVMTYNPQLMAEVITYIEKYNQEDMFKGNTKIII